ncbi:hypothetical protein DOY81_005277 [Sarcophaga bullata]|nr:hypothetical protein DOY81_005277 [Sarcophaga bullata]
MPRLLAAEYVYSGAMDDCYNDYVTSPSTVQQSSQQRHHLSAVIQQTPLPSKLPVAMRSKSNSPEQKTCNTSNQQLLSKSTEQQQIHTISSSDEDELVTEQNTIEEEITNVSSGETEDFEGFDDYTTPNSSGFINDISQNEHNLSNNFLKRLSNTDFNNYFEDSEGVVEAIEVDDDEEISIGNNEVMFYQSKEELTPKKSQMYKCEPHTPSKRKKKDKEDHHLNDILSQHLNTTPDQIVEINSDSTTNSMKQKRQQINNKYQINLSQQQPHKFNNNPNKCSTESTSEFPVSSPSNPQQPRGGKYPPRPPLLKNTLPADSFERQLAMIAACNPQMTLAEKIQSWDCDDELSDVDDVNKFDEEFKRIEKQKKVELKQREKNSRLKNNEMKNYDFLTFRQKILNNMKEQKNQKFNAVGQGSTIVLGSKCLETSGSESSKSVIHVDERPSTSAVAQQQLQQRRSKIQGNVEIGEYKKRIVKGTQKRNQNSTTPPQTSSSDNERDFFHKTKNHDKLCRSSSEEAISQDVPAHIFSKANIKIAQNNLKNLRRKSPNKSPLLPKKTNQTKIPAKNSCAVPDEEIDSVFRLHRLNRERDKHQSISPQTGKDEKPNSIIQMRLDFANENKTELLAEKKQEVFKTPIVPHKYLANHSPILNNTRQTNISPTKSQDSLETANCTKMNSSGVVSEDKSEVSYKKVEKNSEHNDVDGVYHQQHEFCNYLGLTGMSTATAMANAVAELAQCNLARRSMRVLRQQKERKDKTAKEERELESLKSRKQTDFRKRDKGGCENVTQLETYSLGTVIKSEDSSYSQTSEETFKEAKKDISNILKRNSSIISPHSVTIIKKEPEIKILCHISTNKKEDVERISKECVKEITQPIREVLMRRAKQINSRKHSELSETNIVNQEENKSERCMSSKCILTKKEIKTDCFGSDELLSTKAHSRGGQQSQIAYKTETIADTTSTTKSSGTCASPFIKQEDSYRTDDASVDNDGNVFKPSKNLTSSTPNIIQQKIKMALEESRKSKPSIFIVQSIECQKDISNKLQQTESESGLEPNKELDEYKVQADAIQSLSDLGKNYKKNEIKNIYKKRRGRKYPTSKRQLRKRKIIVIKTVKPKLKSYTNSSEFKRELRSSPKIKQPNTDIQPECCETKSYRTVQTETSDLDLFVNSHYSQKKTRIMAKASALLERSRRLTLRSRGNLTTCKSKVIPKAQRSNLFLHSTKTQIIKPATERLPSFLAPNVYGCESENKDLQIDKLPQTISVADNDNVVVSSTTNTYDERPSNEALVVTQSPITLGSIYNSASYVITPSSVETKEQFSQCNLSNSVQYLNNSSSCKQSMKNPLKMEYGSVLYIYHELDILIVIQERLVSFWKYSKLINILTLFPSNKANYNPQTNPGTTPPKDHNLENCCNNQVRQPASLSILTNANSSVEWIQLGELRRLNYDTEISIPYANRICLHNSTPIYLEMRAQQLPKNHRDCNLLSMYINIYYYHDEDMIAKCNSIELDTIQSDVKFVNYTTLHHSRYFIMTWPQENPLGKTRSGLCKYSLTPQLDTLASIREFKNFRHTIRYLQCLNDDKLIGFGDTQVTIWDHRSGDVLMNYDLEIPMGINLGSMYFSSQDVELNNILILHQYHETENNTAPVLKTIACTVTHTQPSYRVLQEINLPSPAFNVVKSSVNTGDHLVIAGENDDELWISATNPTSITIIPGTQNSKRFYNRERSLLIELTDKSLNVNSLANYLLQLAADKTLN